MHLGYHEIEVQREAFRRAVLREFVRLELLTKDDARSMLPWPHGGSHVNHPVRLEADNPCGILQLARYSTRAPIGLERLQYDARKQQVTLQSDRRQGPTTGSHVFPALEFLAMFLAAIADGHERLIRAYGAYSVRRRHRWRRAWILSDTCATRAVIPAGSRNTPPPGARRLESWSSPGVRSPVPLHAPSPAPSSSDLQDRHSGDSWGLAVLYPRLRCRPTNRSRNGANRRSETALAT